KLLKLLEKIDQNLPESNGFTIYGGGLRILEDEPKHLKTVFEYVAKGGKFFLENVSSNRSHGAACAKETSLNYMRALVFIDGGLKTDKALEEVSRHAAVVKKIGSGVLIFRSPKNAAEVIPSMVAGFDTTGIKIVPLSSLFVK
ncbi:MAG: divergent polysaccharide deacetylase family protein, partial [Fibrobacteres bacterium]|nr:divergent polysaccharide deacetylase family protein [Fibrobacterota bacterium]